MYVFNLHIIGSDWAENLRMHWMLLLNRMIFCHKSIFKVRKQTFFLLSVSVWEANADKVFIQFFYILDAHVRRHSLLLFVFRSPHFLEFNFHFHLFIVLSGPLQLANSPNDSSENFTEWNEKFNTLTIQFNFSRMYVRLPATLPLNKSGNRKYTNKKCHHKFPPPPTNSPQ